MMKRSIKELLMSVLVCAVAASLAGCSTPKEPVEVNDVFKAENASGYSFEMHVNGEGKVIKVIENGEEYDAESLAGVQTVVDDLGLKIFYEAQSYSVSQEDDATITYNGEEYSLARKELFANYLNVSKCSKVDGDMVYSFEFDTKDEKIVGMTLNFVYKGDFTMFKGNEELIMSVIDYVKALVAASMNEMELSSEDVKFEILDEGMSFMIELEEDVLNAENDDLITMIISLTQENQGFVCE